MSPASRPERILLISDLHLAENRPDLTCAFLDFLAREASQARLLCILGDFFNLWIGDDDDRPLNSEITRALRTQADTGLAILLMHGNRDFLLGADFAARSGATLLEQDQFVLGQGANQCLIMHGDTLCTRDTDYQQFRSMVRDPAWQQEFLARPLSERRAFAEQARSRSLTMNSNKAADIMDVSQDAVASIMRQHGMDMLVHGHTHRPGQHEFTVDGRQVKRIVLGDWDQYGWVLELTPEQIELRQFAI